MPETRRLCRKCFKRRKLDSSGRCRQCNPTGTGTVCAPGLDASTSGPVSNNSNIPTTTAISTTSTASTAIATATSNDLSASDRTIEGDDVPPSLAALRRARALLIRSKRGGSTESDQSNASESLLPTFHHHDDDYNSLTAQLDNRAVHQMQMFADFFQSHLPAASAAEVGRARSISYLANIPFFSTSSPLLSAAIDALCLAHIGSARQDIRLLHASQNSYGTVLATIRRLLASSSTHSLSSREIIMAIMVISLFDECMPVEHRASNSSMTHLWGAQQYLAATPPSRFDLTHPLDRTLVLHVFQNGFWLALAKRQSVRKGRADWIAVQNAMFPSRTPYTILASLPYLIEQTDNLLSQEDIDLTELIVLCTQLQDIRHEVYSRLQNDRTTIQPELVHNTDVDAFDLKIEEHRVIMTSTVFGTHHRFPGPESAVNFACRAIIFLVLDCTLLRIFHFRPTVCAFPFRRSPAEVERDATGWAAALCQSVHQFSQLRSLAYLDFLTLFLELALNFFQEQGASQEVEWCQACLTAGESRLQRLRTVHPPTLCRIGDLPAGIKAAGKYRTAQLNVSEAKTADARPDHRPTARRADSASPAASADDPHYDFSTSPGLSTPSPYPYSVSPASSVIVPQIERWVGQ